jgi:hypothetical protein
MEAAWSLDATAGLGRVGNAGFEVAAATAICAFLLVFLVTIKRCALTRSGHAMPSLQICHAHCQLQLPGW